MVSSKTPRVICNQLSLETSAASAEFIDMKFAIVVIDNLEDLWTSKAFEFLRYIE